MIARHGWLFEGYCTAVLSRNPHSNCAMQFQIGLYVPAETDLEHFCNTCGVRDMSENGCKPR